ncbi:MAG: ADP-forming succinate--CoA ligase subunit beta [Acidimicrobiales bacterium]|nr:MAG: ADP-forming succinate--CoA ligase subunit beta [Acidimicrobiales bacterium]
MDLLEYQGKQYLARYGVPVSSGGLAGTVEEAVTQAELMGYPVMLKAQVPVGGRGKAGGVRRAVDLEDLTTCARAILGLEIKGHLVRRLWLEKACDVAREYYASFTLDRAARLHLAMVSAKGGVEIEAVAAETPAAIVKAHIDPVEGLSPAAAAALAAQAGLDERARAQAGEVLLALYRCFVDGDADLVEINPLVLMTDGRLQALDAKVILDDSAAYRHPEWQEWAGTQEIDDRERLARERGLNYIGLSGNVGIIANGAGLAMSTLDVVTQVGGSAANFLDVGGGANADVMTAALEVINTDANVASILVNIFGGITRCDHVADGIVEALHRVELRAPIVVRLDGTNAAQGRAILAAHESDRLISRPTMLAAAAQAVELAGPGR